ncbi:hypothetical protein M408DRAFT_23467 [Serendipita vermifera MAFF 305830]|uniref:Mediator of RNA polymerase II transcription subunit 9 n=1 Tax=Serendipita vermifera MAFF 305830 TaxID=933852 RepID=A0A0C3AWA7_SERVB|nr:hypothetical protein M408DRAFT_23467 [Serendipita vermifera MAFF 305830]
MASDDPFPISTVEGLVPAVLRVYSLIHDISYTTRKPLETGPTPQEIVEATDDLKRRFLIAKDLVEKLPGGEMNADSQDEVIKMLEKWRDSKREQLQKHFTKTA